MKLQSILTLLFISLIFAGCTATESVTETSVDAEQNEELQQDRADNFATDETYYYRDLSDYLERIPGVNVSGNSVTIRGVNSFTSGIEPLFVIDGQAVGQNYLQVKNMINVRDIDYVRALKGSDAAIYGVRGGNGVILIVTKK